MAHLLAILVGFSGFVLYMAAFFFPEVHRKNDFIWSGVILFYALALWVYSGRITGGLLLAQIASVVILGWLAWQTLVLRRQITPYDQQTWVSGSGKSIGEVLFLNATQLGQQFQQRWEQLPLPAPLRTLPQQVGRTVDNLRAKPQPKTPPLQASTRAQSASRPIRKKPQPDPTTPTTTPATAPSDVVSEARSGTEEPTSAAAVGAPETIATAVTETDTTVPEAPDAPDQEEAIAPPPVETPIASTGEPETGDSSMPLPGTEPTAIAHVSEIKSDIQPEAETAIAPPPPVTPSMPPLASLPPEDMDGEWDALEEDFLGAPEDTQAAAGETPPAQKQTVVEEPDDGEQGGDRSPAHDSEPPTDEWDENWEEPPAAPTPLYPPAVQPIVEPEELSFAEIVAAANRALTPEDRLVVDVPAIEIRNSSEDSPSNQARDWDDWTEEDNDDWFDQ